jgi:hypothetical protein
MKASRIVATLIVLLAAGVIASDEHGGSMGIGDPEPQEEAGPANL